MRHRLQRGISRSQLIHYGGCLLRSLLVSKIADKVEVISSGSLSLDLALGVGGLPKGCVFLY